MIFLFFCRCNSAIVREEERSYQQIHECLRKMNADVIWMALSSFFSGDKMCVRLGKSWKVAEKECWSEQLQTTWNRRLWRFVTAKKKKHETDLTPISHLQGHELCHLSDFHLLAVSCVLNFCLLLLSCHFSLSVVVYIKAQQWSWQFQAKEKKSCLTIQTETAKKSTRKTHSREREIKKKIDRDLN